VLDIAIHLRGVWMKKTIVYAMVVISLFVIPFPLKNERELVIMGNENNSIKDKEISTNIESNPLGINGIWIVNLDDYNKTIVLDGDISDWAGIPYEEFNGVDVFLTYDNNFVYVATVWEDSSNDGDLSEWNKTGATLDNTTHATWAEYDGADDMVAVGFSNGTYTDMWIWAESLRGDANYAFEVDDYWEPDAGTLPFHRNIDVGPATFGWSQPDMDNNSVLITDHNDLANGTSYIGWFDDTPTESQIDVNIAKTWNATGDDRYIVEFRRALNTSNLDDIKLNFDNLANMSFFVGVEDNQECRNMHVGIIELTLSDTNIQATFDWDDVNSPVNSALLLTGHIWDDFDGLEIWIMLSGWEDTYGPDSWWNYANCINSYTGDWSALFYYDENDMPLGNHVLTVKFKPKYDEELILSQEVTIVDDVAPQLVGLVNMNDRYPNGVPNNHEYVHVTIGASDNYQYYIPGLGYSDTDFLSVFLFYIIGGVVNMVPMVQFSPGGSTFSANITLDHTYTRNITYYVQAFDPIGNTVVSEYLWFYSMGAPTPPKPFFPPLGEFIGTTIGLFIGVTALVISILAIVRLIETKRIKKFEKD